MGSFDENAMISVPGITRQISLKDPPRPDFLFNDVNYSTTLMKFKEAVIRHGGTGAVVAHRAELELILKLISLNLGSFGPRTLTSVSCSLIYMGLNHHWLLKEIAEESIEKIAFFTPHDLALLAWSFARTGEDYDELFKSIDVYCRRIMRAALGPDLTTLVWAFAKKGQGSASLFLEFESAFARLQHLNIISLSTMAWAWSKNGIKSPSLFNLVEKKIMALPPKERVYEARAISNLIWAYGKQGQVPKTLFPELVTQCMENFKDLIPQHLSNISSSLVSLRYDSPVLLNRIRETATKTVTSFRPITLGELAVAYATYAPNSPQNIPLFEGMAKHLVTVVSKTDFERAIVAKTLSEFTWAFAKQGVITEPLLNVLKEQTKVHAQVGTMSDNTLSQTAWGLFQLNRDCDEHLGMLAPSFEGKIEETLPNELVESLWTFGFSKTGSPDLFDKGWKALKRVNPKTLTHTNLLYLGHLNLAASSGLLPIPSTPLPPSLLKEAKEALWAHEEALLSTGSTKMAQDLATQIKALLPVELREKMKINTRSAEGFVLQLAVPEKKFVIELLPAKDFIEDLTTGKRWHSGELKVRSELLKKHKWRVASLQESFWAGLRYDKKQELAMKLASAV